MREFGAMAQVAMVATGKADVAKTSVVALLNELQDAEKQKKLQAHGIKLFDPEELKRGRKVYRAVPEIMKDIIVASKGDGTKIGGILGNEAMRAMSAAITDFQDNKNFSKSIDLFMKAEGDPAKLMEQAAIAAGSFGAAMDRLNGEWAVFADKNLAKPVQDLAGALKDIDPARIQGGLDTAKMVAGGIGAVVLAKKGIDAARWTANTAKWMRGGKGGAGSLAGAAGGAVGGMAGPMPVVVTNWPAGGVGSGAATIADGIGGNAPANSNRGRLGKVTAFASRAGRYLGRSAGIASLALGGLQVGSSLAEGNTRGAVAGGGGMAGALAGGAAGAALGSVVPVVGTAVGGMIGAGLGAYGGEKMFAKLYDWFKERDSKPAEVKGEMTITVATDAGSTAKVSALSSSVPGFEFDVGRMGGGA